MARTPTIAWSADASDTYCAELDPDHAIMAGPGRVWSLDLRNGRNRWSVDIPEGQSGVTCLTGANLVAVQVGASFSTEVKSTLLLDGATGRTVAELPGDEIVQVIPLGKIIGLVDRSNTLRAVAPDKLDDPLWTRSLPVRPNENLSYIHVEQIDALSIQLWYSSGQNVAGGEQTYTPVLSLEDGKDPAWAQKSWSDTTMYQRVGDVVLFYRLVGNDFEASVLDLEGRELWRFDDAEPTVSGSRLYGLSPGTRNEGTENMHELRELDPRSGEPIGTHVFTGEFDYAVAAPQDRLAVFQTGSLTILDEDLQALPTVRGVDYGGTYLGKKLLYTGGNMYQESNARRTRLTAVDPSTARTVWVFYVDPGQRIAQMGRHLVVMDNGGKTIHGLRAGVEMADPNHSFRRPGSHTDRDEEGESPAPGNDPDRTGLTDEPLILDPNFHQSIWKPWQISAAEAGTDGTGKPTGSGTRVSRALLRLGAVGVTLALVGAFIVPRLMGPTDDASQPFLEDLSTRPEIAWSVPGVTGGGHSCDDISDGDTTILISERRVFSLDLRNGSSNWSVDVGSPGLITCLSEADLVAVPIITADQGVLRTKLLRVTNGEEVAELSGDSTVHVIPMGGYIGLVSRSNLLSVVRPESLDFSLWTHQLAGPRGKLQPIQVKQIDDDAVQLSYWTENGSGGYGMSEDYVVTLSLADGTPPLWAERTASDSVHHQRSGDVITRHRYSDDGSVTVSVVDLQGELLWDLENDDLSASGSRLFVSSRSGPSAGSQYTSLTEVDPRTGSPVGNDRYEGPFDYAVAATPGQMWVIHENTYRLLDDHLQELSTLAVDEINGYHVGRKWLYVESTVSEYGEEPIIRLSAIDPNSGKLRWTYDLQADQFQYRMGRHLVLVDEDGTVQGLTSR